MLHFIGYEKIYFLFNKRIFKMQYSMKNKAKYSYREMFVVLKNDFFSFILNHS